jgi:peptidyl-prolyl cis-trans isomerase D
MLKVMRESFHHLKWVLLAVVAAFIFGFVFIDMGMGGGTSTAGGDDRAYALRVNGDTVTYRDYDRALYFAEQNYRSMYGAQMTPEMLAGLGIQKQVIDALIEQKLLQQEAERLNLGATAEEIRGRILEIPTLNPEGKFVGADLYKRYVTGSLGFSSEAEFEEQLAAEITQQKMESALASSVMVSPKAAEAEYKRMIENSRIRYVLYPASREAASVTVTPAEVEAYYRANQAKYAHGEQRNVKYLLADYNRLRSQIVPDDAGLRQRYESNKEQFKTAESARILHILIKVDPSASPEVDAAARARAQALVTQLRGGADFGELARANSADPSSASLGGDMGFVERGQTVPPFDNAAFSIPLNIISEPIRSEQFGYHIIKVLERRPPGYRPYDEVKPQLAVQAAEDQSRTIAKQEMARIAAVIKQKKPNTPDEFAALANDKVTSNDTQWFGKNEMIPGLGFNAPVSNWAFAAKAGDVGGVMATQRGIVIPYLANVRPAGVTPLADIRAKVENDAKLDKGRESAKAKLAAALPGAASIDGVAVKLGLTAADTSVSRQGAVAGMTGDTTALVNAALTAPVGQMQGPIVTGDGAVAFQVVDQKRVTPQEIADNTAAYIDALRNQQARSLRTVLLERLRKTADIDVNQTLMDNANAQQQNAPS